MKARMVSSSGRLSQYLHLKSQTRTTIIEPHISQVYLKLLRMELISAPHTSLQLRGATQKAVLCRGGWSLTSEPEATKAALEPPKQERIMKRGCRLGSILYSITGSLMPFDASSANSLYISLRCCCSLTLLLASSAIGHRVEGCRIQNFPPVLYTLNI